MTPLDPSEDKPFVLATVSGPAKISQVTGAESENSTDRYAVHGTDLGSMFTMDGKTYLVFGDTFGEREEGHTGGGRSLWRSNAMGYTTDTDPSDGLRLDGMITDDIGLAKELLGSRKTDGDEMTVIPTYGFAVGTTMYLHYMSVRHWGAPGRWEANRAGLAKSADQGKTWTLLESVTWPGDSAFVQVAVQHLSQDGLDYLYFWSIAAGRFGGVRLMRVAATEAENLAAYRYFAGHDPAGQPKWESDQKLAATIVDDTAGELSVVHNSYLDRWIMMYLKEGSGVVIREGITPWGPWSEPHVAVSATQFPRLYAPFQYPAVGDGQRIYFNLSLWDPYNVFVFSIDLQKVS